MLAVAVEFAGGGGDVSLTFMLGFFGFCVFLVAMALYFNLTRNHHEYYLDEHWGDASIDDDEWGFALADAKRATQRKLAELADRDSARLDAR